MTFPRLLPVRLAALVSIATLTSSTWADDKAQCASAYEAAQELRTKSKLREARNNLLVCAQSTCPAFIKKDCNNWLSEVEAALPTVVLSAKANGKDISDVSVKIDGDELAETLDGKALPVDPGTHTFRFESDQYGSKETRYVVKEGQKNQSVEVEFAGAQSKPGGGEEGGGGDTGTTLSTSEPGQSKTLAYVLLGVGAVGVAGFAYFGLTGNSEKNDLACADTKTCTDDDLSPIRQKYLFADISLGVGLVSLGVGTYLLLSSSKTKPPAAEQSARVHVDLAPAKNGGFALLSGSF